MIKIDSMKAELQAEIFFLFLKYPYAPEMKIKFSKLITKLNEVDLNKRSIKQIKKELYKDLSSLYDTLKIGLELLAIETMKAFNLPSTHYVAKEEALLMGLTLDEVIQNKIKSHFNNLISKKISNNLEVNKLKRQNINSVSSLSHDYIKSVRHEIYKRTENDNIKGWLFSAILDRRTSNICVSQNNKFYSKSNYSDRGALPYIPNVSTHPRCRSILITIYKGDDIQKFKETSLDDMIKDDTYEFKKLIGVKKFNLVKQGNLNAIDIFDYKNNKFFTVKEIEDMLNNR